MVSISMEQGNKPIIDGVPGATVAPDGPMNALEGGLWNRIPGWFQRSLGFAAVIPAPIALLLGVRDLFNISGPGWAVAIAVSNATIMLAAVVSVFEMQHRQDNALRTQERSFRRDAAVSAALPELHLAFHELRNAAVLIDDGNNALTYHDTMIRSLGHMSNMFRMVTSAPCRLCIKDLAPSPDRPTELDEDDLRFLEVTTPVCQAGVRHLRQSKIPLRARTRNHHTDDYDLFLFA